jgi:tRNA-specific 2-thiouridylase
MENSQKTVVVGMSGGVDSSVAALLLKEQGYKVIGLFMKNWDEDSPECTSEEDYQDVTKICEKLDIPYYTINFVKEYWENVFQDFLEEYKKGRTPNPDILCNREIKFKVFYDKAMALGADYLATGHYCQTNQKGELIKGLDPNKDQSYFLYAVQSDVLKNVLFPIGHLEKPEVRRLAEEHDLVTHDKKDSTGICFIGERNFRNFLSSYIKNAQGKFEDLEGNIVGDHQGVPFYTLGQRKGLGLGGPGEPWFVVGKDLRRNVVQVARGLKHPALFSDYLTVTDLSWVTQEPQYPLKCTAKIRYRQKDQECLIERDKNGLKVTFPIPQRAATPGQSVVFYKGNTCLGGGIIDSVGPSYFEMKRDLPEITAP